MELVTAVDRYLTVSKMNEIYNAFITLNELVTAIHILPRDLIDTSVRYDTSPVKVTEKMNGVEKNIQAFHYAVEGSIDGWYDEYFKEFDWSRNVKNKKQEVQRWINWINSFYSMLNNIEITYYALHYSDGNALYTAADEPIYYVERKIKE